MTDDTNDEMISLLGRLDPLRDDQLARVVGIGRANGGAERIVATPWRRARRPQPARRRTLTLAAVAAAACLAAALGVTLRSSSPTTAYALSFSESGGYVIARIVNPYASVDELRRELASNHLHVALKLLPVSPGLVGKVSMIDVNGSPGDGIQPLLEGKCANGPCTVGVKVARAFKGSGYVEIGRPARRGERYASTPIGGTFAAGELLHCSGLQGASVAKLTPVLQSKRLKVVGWRVMGEPSLARASKKPNGVTWRRGESASAPADQAPAGDLVQEVMPVAPGEVELWVVSPGWRDAPASPPRHAGGSASRQAPGVRPSSVLHWASTEGCGAS